MWLQLQWFYSLLVLPVSVKKTFLQKMIHLGISYFRAPTHGLESSFCCWTAGQGLAEKECFLRDTGMNEPRGGSASQGSCASALLDAGTGLRIYCVSMLYVCCCVCMYVCMYVCIIIVIVSSSIVVLSRCLYVVDGLVVSCSFRAAQLDALVRLSAGPTLEMAVPVTPNLPTNIIPTKID